MKHLLITGFMGTGKSVVGRLVAERLGLPFVDTDAEVERLAGRSVRAIFRDEGEPRFRELESEALRVLDGREASVIATGGGTLLRADNRDAALAMGLVVCLWAAAEEIVRRLESGEARPLLAGAERRDARIRALLAEREAVYSALPNHVDTTGKTPEQVSEEIVALWQNRLLPA